MKRIVTKVLGLVSTPKEAPASIEELNKLTSTFAGSFQNIFRCKNYSINRQGDIVYFSKGTHKISIKIDQCENLKILSILDSEKRTTKFNITPNAVSDKTLIQYKKFISQLSTLYLNS